MRSLSARLAVLLVILSIAEVIPNSIPSSPISSSKPGNDDSEAKVSKPNIVIILADDLGWNDVSFHGSNQIPTPNIDALAYNGLILNNHYVAPLCTPSRASFLTGKYPIHMGMQHLVLFEPEPRGLPLGEKLLPEYLKEVGYKTHAVGKWHLGYYQQEYTPTFRGFDSHFGYWNGFQDYYSHIVQSTKEKYRGFDMRRNMSVAWDTSGKYSTDLFTEEAVHLIENHDQQNPMFLYLAHLAPHTGNEDHPFQAPDEEIAKFSYIVDAERRTYAAMVSKLDQSVGEVVAALRRRDMLDNSIIIFLSDNGAPTMGIHSNRGSNYPLRGIKDSPWEGAVRGVGAVWSPLIKNPKRISNDLMHITDWLPTLYSAAGFDPIDLGIIDGINLWPTLVSEKSNPRTEVLINIDEISNYASIRIKEFKYISGSTKNGNSWYGETGRRVKQDTEGCLPEYNPQDVLNSKAGIAFSGSITSKQVNEIRKLRETKSVNGKSKIQILTPSAIINLRKQAELNCSMQKENEVPCDPLDSPCLFNIKEDPCEKVNLAKVHPELLKHLKEALVKYNFTAKPASNVENDPKANPANWNETWISWRDTISTKASIKREVSGQGIIIAIIAIIFGLLIVGMFVLVGLNCAKKSFQKFEQEKISRRANDLTSFRAIHSLKDVAKNLD